VIQFEEKVIALKRKIKLFDFWIILQKRKNKKKATSVARYVFRETSLTLQHANTPTHQHTNTHNTRHTSTPIQPTKTPATMHQQTKHQHTNTPTHQHTNTPTHQHTNTPTHQHANTQYKTKPNTKDLVDLRCPEITVVPSSSRTIQKREFVPLKLFASGLH
jgi:hypothetical protein